MASDHLEEGQAGMVDTAGLGVEQDAGDCGNLLVDKWRAEWRDPVRAEDGVALEPDDNLSDRMVQRFVAGRAIPARSRVTDEREIELAAKRGTGLVEQRARIRIAAVIDEQDLCTLRQGFSQAGKEHRQDRRRLQHRDDDRDPVSDGALRPGFLTHR